MENTTKKDFGLIKKLLNNIPLLRWVKKFSANGLQDDDKSQTFNIEVTNDSIAVADKEMVKMLFTSARFKGTKYASFNLRQIRETLALIDGEGRLSIGEDEENKRFCYVEAGENIVVIAPFTDADEKAEKKAKQEKEKKGAKEKTQTKKEKKEQDEGFDGDGEGED